MLVFVALSWTACQEEQCTPDICLNGSCDGEACLCDPGFEGSECDFQSRSRLLGEWEVGDICRQTATVYTVNISEESEPDVVSVDDLNEQGVAVRMRIEGASIELPAQAFGVWTVSGTGGIDTTANVISLEYRIDLGGGQEEVCQAVFRRN